MTCVTASELERPGAKQYGDGSASPIERYTPPSLGRLTNPPVFLLRAGSRRERDHYQRLMFVAGVREHSVQRIRDETMNGLRALWDKASFDQYADRILTYWVAVDALVERRRESSARARLAFPANEARAIEGLLDRVADAWEPLQRLGADNAAFSLRSPAVTLAITIVGWEGFDVAFAREAGVVPLDVIERVKAGLDAIERGQSGESIGEVGTAYLELCTAAAHLLFNAGTATR